MSRRRKDDTSIAESDSFLDIVANIVGILIILIVVVGVRVGESARQAESPATVVSGADRADKSAPAVVAPVPRIIESPTPEAPEPIAPDPRILATIDETSAQLERLHADLDTAETARQELAKAAEIAAKELARFNTELGAVADEIQETGRLAASMAANREKLSNVERKLQDQLSDLPADRVDVLKVELNPIGRAVRGEELHFRLAGGRVSHVPLKTFIERLKPRIEEQKAWVARHHRHEGSLGPFDGYKMEYVIERDPLTLAEELQIGSRVVRISVTGWKVVPQDTLVTEPADQALGASSRFRQALRMADRGATLTFWVYPDSFAAYRRLQQFAHERGFEVAARPLPTGVPIAGSPDGSRSSSQ